MAANEDRSDRTRDTGISHPAEPYDQPARPLRARKPVSASQSPEIKPRKTPLGGMLSEVQRLLNADPSNEWVDFRSRGRPISQREIALLLDAYDVHPTYIHRGRKTERGYRVEHLPKPSGIIFPNFQLASVQACARRTIGTGSGENGARLHGCRGCPMTIQHGAQGPSVLCAANDRQRGNSDRDPRCRRRAGTSSCSARRPSETNHARQRQQPIREQDQPGTKLGYHLQITSSPK